MAVLDRKVALITGAKGGLGGDVTKAFLQAGATVAGVSRSIQSSDFPDARFTAFPAELSDGGPWFVEDLEELATPYDGWSWEDLLLPSRRPPRVESG